MRRPRQSSFKHNLSSNPPRKSLGQHFLVDPNITAKIIKACEFQKDDVVLEIGPGRGALTSRIAPFVKKLIAIEKDRRFCQELKSLAIPNLELIEADFLTSDFHTIKGPVKVVGNLPYYIASPIIEKIVSHRDIFTELYATVQWEFGQRMVAQRDTKDYSALT